MFLKFRVFSREMRSDHPFSSDPNKMKQTNKYIWNGIPAGNTRKEISLAIVAFMPEIVH
jgi:hypothetical protein